MTNNEIVMIVYNTINIKGICYKMGIMKDVDDIEQIIYDIVLRYDNDKLNNIHKNGALLSFVWICVRNQIKNNTKGEWYMLNSSEYIDFDIELVDDINDEKNNMLEFIDNEFKVKYYSSIKKMTIDEKTEYIHKLLLKNKILKRWTLNEMRDKFGISRNVINNIIQNSKKQLRDKYDRNNN